MFSCLWVIYPMTGLMVASSKMTYATRRASQVWCSQNPCPCGRPLLTPASTGGTQTLKRRSGSVSCGVSGSWCTQSFFEPSVYVYLILDPILIDCVNHNKLWKILKEMGIPNHLTCLLRNLYAGQEAAVRTRHGKTDWFKVGKGISQGCILSPCLFNLYAEYITQNLGWMKTSWNQDCWEKYQQSQICR